MKTENKAIYFDKKQILKIRRFCIEQSECVKCKLYRGICSQHSILSSNINECKFILGVVNEYNEKKQN